MSDICHISIFAISNQAETYAIKLLGVKTSKKMAKSRDSWSTFYQQQVLYKFSLCYSMSCRIRLLFKINIAYKAVAYTLGHRQFAMEQDCVFILGMILIMTVAQ